MTNHFEQVYQIPDFLQTQLEEMREQIAERGISNVSKRKLKGTFRDLVFELNNCLEKKLKCYGIVGYIQSLFESNPELLEEAMKYCHAVITGNDNDNPLAGYRYRKIEYMIYGMNDKTRELDSKIWKCETEQNLKKPYLNN